MCGSLPQSSIHGEGPVERIEERKEEEGRKERYIGSQIEQKSK